YEISKINNYLVNCGSSIKSVINNCNFIGDSSKLGSSFFTSATKTSIVSLNEEIPSRNLLPLHHTTRIYNKPLTYVFEIKRKGTHLINESR
ncbi:hypothetical protein FRX31_012492, partial [Thalictrum thalictroides]